MLYTLGFAAAGYLSGSVLYANVFSRLLNKPDMLEKSRDGNPGTANAFMYGGFACGVLTLLFDILKGFLPVFLFMQFGGQERTEALPAALVMAAPVVGHGFSVFNRFRGGKGIAVTFGCLIGLLPIWLPLVIFAVAFVLLSVIFRVNPHYYRTFTAYTGSAAAMIILGVGLVICTAFIIMTACVCIKLFTSSEQKERLRVRLLWMH
ncbi:MAG: glycerol-3-phosphate acyltransferase [Lachnospiraceae bacterium]|nr:glycerol-3-phosphate acyltransferase [Lachnospiraceae bacterium]